jgi:hypothetical protein
VSRYGLSQAAIAAKCPGFGPKGWLLPDTSAGDPMDRSTPAAMTAVRSNSQPETSPWTSPLCAECFLIINYLGRAIAIVSLSLPEA